MLKATGGVLLMLIALAVIPFIVLAILLGAPDPSSWKVKRGGESNGN